MLGERRQQLEFERRQRNELAAYFHFAAGEVDRVFAVVVDVLDLAAIGLGAAQNGLDARDELRRRERLDDVVVGATAQAADALELGGARGEHDHGNVGHLADPLQHLPAVDPRHDDIEQDQIRLQLVELAHSFGALDRRRDEVAVLLEAARDDRALGLAVVDQ